MNKKIVALVLAAAILASVQLAEAQKPANVRRVGFLNPAEGPSLPYDVLRGSLRELGYTEGQNIAFEYRATADVSRLAEMAIELVRQKVDVIVAQGGAAIRAARMSTDGVPVVFGFSGDPVEAGYINNLARPGGNLTGTTFLAYELVGKRLELLKEAVPKASYVAVLSYPDHAGEQRELRETGAVAQHLGVALQYLQVRTSSDFDKAFDAIAGKHADALLVFPEAITLARRQQIAEFAARHRLPSVFGW